MPSVIFIHGLSNKPEANDLLNLYRRKLAFEDGFSLEDNGIDSALVYWADVLYPSPDTDLEAYESTGSDVLKEAAAAPSPHSVTAEADSPAERAFVARLSSRLEIGPEDLDPAALTPEERAAIRHERIPLPAGLRNRLMAKFVRDAHLYFFNKEFSPRTGATFRVRDELRRRFMDALATASVGAGPVVVVSHSMGTIVAYDCLMHEPACPAVQGLMTVGSPLGLDEVQDFFPGRTVLNGFPSSKLHGPWVNVYDALDVVAAADPRLANDYLRNGLPAIDDVEEPNWGTWRHSISKYLRGRKLREKLASMMQVEWT